MRRFPGFVAAVLLTSPALAATSRTYAVPPFERIQVAAGIELKARVGAPQSVTAATGDGDFSGLVVAVDDGSLVVRRAHHWYLFDWFDESRYTVTVAVPVLRGVHASSSATAEVTGAVSKDAVIGASSSGRVRVAEVQGGKVLLEAASSGQLELGVLHGEAISLHASSSGKIRVDDLHGPEIQIRVSSSGAVEASGGCGTLSVGASSSGRVRTSGLRCEHVAADASSSGSVAVFAAQGATARASSGGRIAVVGKPQHVEQHESSGGTIDVVN